MTNDLEVLFQKFDNFKAYLNEVAVDKHKLKPLLSQSNDQMLARSVMLLAVYKKINSIDLIINTTCVELGITKQEHKDKIKRYFECFIEYLSSMHPDVQPIELTDDMRKEINDKYMEMQDKKE